jgi:hypothetical protein
MSEQNDEQKKEAGACGPGCNCGTTGGVGSRMKWLICGVVALAAVVTVAAHVSRTRAANHPAKALEYAVSIPGTAGAAAAQPAAVPEADVWAAPLKALSELNVVATNTEAVFVVLPSSDVERMTAIRKEVSAAAATITARGSRMGKFLLSQDSQEYAALAKQIGTPAVLAMYKGRGMAGVPDKEITQDGLLKAFVGASRPSGCGPSGCGPGASGCK